MKILFISHTASGGPFVVGSHHLAKALAAMGNEVLHLSPPITPAHLLRMGDPFERTRVARWISRGTERQGFLDIVPVSPIPWGVAKALGNPYKFFGRAVQQSALRLLRHHGFSKPDLIVVDEPRLGSVAETLGCGRIVYRPTDVYAELRMDPSIVDAERALASIAHRFVATSEPVAQHLRSLGVGAVRVIENGVDLDHFVDGVDHDVSEHIPQSPVAVYAGALDRRFGADVVAVAAASNPDINFLLIGPDNARCGERLSQYANVKLLGPVDFSLLPSYLRRCDVALLPLSNDRSNQGRSPMKLYEYASLGLPIVATATPELERRRLAFVLASRSAEEFSANVRHAIQLKDHTTACIEAATANGWKSKAEQLLSYAMGAAEQ